MRRVLCLLSCAVSCHGPSADPNPGAAAKGPSAQAVSLEIASLSAAERRRDATAIGAEALSSRDPKLRRSAARALARIADARAAELLPLALADEDAEVSAWGAYGLGYACRGRETDVVHALVARAASLRQPNAQAPKQTQTLLESPMEAISDALGRCASAEAESTLRAWLHGPKARAEAAALSLGRLVERAGKLEDKTVVMLLDAAARPQDGVDNALYPLTRLASLNASTAERALTLARAAIPKQGPGAEFALRVLARAGEPGSAELARRLTDATLTPGLRAEAARELNGLGSAGQHALWAAFDQGEPEAASDANLGAEEYGPFSAVLDALQPPVVSSGARLTALTELTLNAQDSLSLTRRKVHVRCTAAALLAGSNYENARLLACDPAPASTARELAVLRVLGRDELLGRRKRAYLQRASGADFVLREAALELLTEHPELPEAYRVLAQALGAKPLGVVASAAHVLATYPERASRVSDASADAHAAPNPDPSVVQALAPAYAAARDQHSVEVQSLLLDAAGALQVLSLKESVNEACVSDNPTLREHAEKALHSLGEQGRRCDEAAPGKGLLWADNPLIAGKTLLTLETEAGTLSVTLDAAFAPNAVARVVALAQAGFYDGIAVHRVVPGFVAQFGDPSGDGYGGDGKPPLRCETAPVPFSAGGVGIALSGRDTGSSQLFVTLGRYPHLDGQYAWIGQAGPGWDRVAAGDRIMHVQVSALP